VKLLVEETDLRRRMSIEAREQAQRMSWDAAFSDVYNAYDNFKDKKVGSGQAIGAASVGTAQA